MKGKKRRIELFVVPLIAWLGLFAIGMSLYHGVQFQDVPGYPNRGQLVLYVFLPLSMVLSNLLVIWASLLIPRWISYLVLLFQVPLWVAVFALFGGGV